jgi:methylmalonyl-CoA mutase
MPTQREWPAATRESWTRRAAEELEGRDLASLVVATPSGIPVEPLHGAWVDERVEALPEGLRPTAGWRPAEDLDLARGGDPFESARGAVREGIEVLRCAAHDGTVVARVAAGAAAAGARPVVVVRGEVLARSALTPGATGAVRAGEVELHGGHDPVRGLLTGDAAGEPDVARSPADVEFLRAFDASGQRGRAFEIDASILREAGGTALDELVHVLACTVERWRAAQAHGLSGATFAAHLAVRVAVGRDLFEEVAKLRALRLLFGRLAASCGVQRPARLVVHAASARRELARVDEPTNALRTTAHAVAAALGGADTLALAPFEPGSRRGERLARTTHAVLRHEVALANVDDPTGGAWYVEQLVDALARAAWREFQAIESAGGLSTWARTGDFAARLDRRRAALVAAIAAGQHVLVGANRYPAPLADGAAAPAPRPAPGPLSRGGTGWPHLEPLCESDFAAPPPRRSTP